MATPPGGVISPSVTKLEGDAPDCGGTDRVAPRITAGAADPRSFLTVVSPFPGWPKDGAGVRKGAWAKSTSTGAYSAETLWAVVDEAGDIVKLEYGGNETQGFVDTNMVYHGRIIGVPLANKAEPDTSAS